VQARSADAPIQVNDTPVDDSAELESGDLVYVGPLQLEVYFHSTAEERRALAEASSDPVEEKISDWLIHQDEEDRQTRLRDSKSRHFKLDETAVQKLAGKSDEGQTSSAKAAARPALPQRKKPGKLPQRPASPTSKSSEAAAEGALKQIFTRWGDKKEKKGDEPEKK
jgi:hypothetical protein